VSATAVLQAHAILHERLQERRTEIEEAVLTRVQSVSDSSEVSDPEYAAGLRTAVVSAIEYGLDGIKSGEGKSPPIPANLFVQARLAARNGVSLDTVLRRYLVGYTLLNNFLIEEYEAGDSLRDLDLKHLLRTQTILFDSLLAAVSEEYGRDRQNLRSTVVQRRAELVERLLVGELLDSTELAYDFEGWHLGMVAVESDATEFLADLARFLDRRLLAIHPEDGAVWAWLGGRRSFDGDELKRLASLDGSVRVFAIGEPAQGLPGWRLTHRQARAALAIARRRPDGGVVRYADVALLTSILQDDLLAASLRKLYLEPLADERDEGEVLRQTLRAYLETGSNVSSAAASLGVNRHTVTNRLRIVEDRLGRSINSCTTEIDVALRLEEPGLKLI
jgi:hypothetical protein